MSFQSYFSLEGLQSPPTRGEAGVGVLAGSAMVALWPLAGDHTAGLGVFRRVRTGWAQCSLPRVHTGIAWRALKSTHAQASSQSEPDPMQLGLTVLYRQG